MISSLRFYSHNLFQKCNNRTTIRHLSTKSSSLQITRIAAYAVGLPLHEKAYKWAGGKQVEVFDATVVVIETNQGITGYGENTPLGQRPARMTVVAVIVKLLK